MVLSDSNAANGWRGVGAEGSDQGSHRTCVDAAGLGATPPSGRVASGCAPEGRGDPLAYAALTSSISAFISSSACRVVRQRGL